jgi:hypothetical protein
MILNFIQTPLKQIGYSTVFQEMARNSFQLSHYDHASIFFFTRSIISYHSAISIVRHSLQSMVDNWKGLT